MSSQNPLSIQVLVVAAWIAMPTAAAQAAWPHDPVYGGLPVCTVPGDQNTVAAADDGAGGIIMAWADQRSGTFDVYAQRIDASGAPLWAADGIAVCTAPSDQDGVRLVADGAGGAVIVWQDARAGAVDIYAQRIDAGGTALWAANGVAVSAAAGNQYAAEAASDGAGGAMVAWLDDRSGNADVYALRISSSGTPIGTPNGTALCVDTQPQAQPRIASDGAGGAIVDWSDFRNTVDYDIYAQRINASGGTLWTPNGVPVSTDVNSQQGSAIAPDGAGGAIITWTDFRGGDADVYAQRISSTGTLLWGAGAVAVVAIPGDEQGNPKIAADGAGGAFIAWSDTRSAVDYDCYAQRLSAAGARLWGIDGIAIRTGTGAQRPVSMISDEAGGVIVVMTDNGAGDLDLYAQRANGTGVSQWAAPSGRVSNALLDQTAPAVVRDGSGGFIAAWTDHRSGEDDVYAQRVNRFGYLDAPEPVIAGVTDVPNDQGGRVKLSWQASYFDTDPAPLLDHYWIFRSVPSASAEAALAGGAAVFRSGVTPELGAPLYLSTVTESGTIFWELLDTVPAIHFIEGYSYLAATTGDSTGASNPRTLFMVMGLDAFNALHWDSAPDSGYSVDNLAPGVVSPFTGAYAEGATHLHWGESAEPDVGTYRIYRGASAGFVPGPGNLIAAQADTGYADPGPAGAWYKISAVDVHGNEGPFALLAPTQTTDASDAPGHWALSLSSPYPNPSARRASVRFTLPQPGRVSLAVYDAAGRRVRALRDGVLEAGAYDAAFELVDGAGRRLGAGLYLVRLETPAGVRTTRLAVLR